MCICMYPYMCVYVGGTPNSGRVNGKERVIFTRFFFPLFSFLPTSFPQFSLIFHGTAWELSLRETGRHRELG